MSFQLTYNSSNTIPEIELPSSKSISNRLLIASALSSNKIELVNLSDARDTVELQNALSSTSGTVDVGMAGTAYRFLTAYFALQTEKRILTGASRMKERPIGILVEELRKLGANVKYLDREGFPPLEISDGNIKGGKLTMDASVSSQYISALLLVAPYLDSGLEIDLMGEVVSYPYIDLTIALQNQLSVTAFRKENKVVVLPGDYSSKKEIVVEADWSSAAFFYQLVAFSEKSLFIKNLNPNSQQGDVACWKLFQNFGVSTNFVNNGALLSYDSTLLKRELQLDLTKTPDLIPSIAVTASQLLDKITIIGTKTLYIKESNRVEALRNELLKVGALLNELNGNSLEIISSRLMLTNAPITFSTYNDHRMAMCLAPLAIYTKVQLDQKMVVEKSFPNFWIELEKFGISN
jgi:3-phosphoshikimate 1-carboxyvinyltransferase